MKTPTTPGGIADLLYKKRTARLKLEKAVEDAKKEETDLKERLFKLLPKLDATSVTGKVATVSIERVHVPTIKDWEKLCRYVKSNGAFDLLQRRVNAKAWRERLEANRAVPGVESYTDYKIHCSKK